METIQAQTANTLPIPARPQSGSIDPARQNQQMPVQDTGITQETSRPVQQAFEVQISREARDQADAAASDRRQDTDAQKTVPSQAQPPGQLYSGRGSIVNIVT